ncbi:hypothetical protein HP1_133 [Candidatus Termititenax spirochaetophilus]|uniref:Uncharacterized protein n=1 Tax=Candidatus Termititenax spirochaetophilus TaxID=2218522 RepID=A0A388T6X7_9BACT|nr:hypothetical protein HP1_133 [Candidatus Termititenax spirochaetophilus]
MKKLAVLLLFCALFAETSIDGVAIGDTYDTVAEKYPFIEKNCLTVILLNDSIKK